MEQNLLREIEKLGSVIGRQKVDTTASQMDLKGKNRILSYKRLSKHFCIIGVQTLGD